MWFFTFFDKPEIFAVELYKNCLKLKIEILIIFI